QGKETPAGFETKEQQPAVVGHHVSAEYAKKSEELRSNAVEIAKAIVQQPQAGTPTPPDQTRQTAESRQPKASLRSGKLVSGDSFIASSAKRKWLHETF